ncbi:MAG: STAS domain-containing protein [Gammaproteobacteria bacterium]|nr:STAS domain-containing protein [Gammaproteobacteria bacterium]
MSTSNEKFDSPLSDLELPTAIEPPADRASTAILREIVAHLRQRRAQLLEAWASRISEAGFLTAMSAEEVLEECGAMYDNYLAAVETGSSKSLDSYAHELSERTVTRGVGTHEVVGTVLLLRDVLAKSLYAEYGQNQDNLTRVLGAYGPAASRIATMVAVGFVREHEHIIRQQQEAMRKLSTPVLTIHERLLILPIIGILDPQRARQLTEQLLEAIRSNRAKVVVMDLTGVATMDAPVANNLVQTVGAARLLGAEVIITGVSPELARTLVTIGVDLEKLATVGDLRGGIERAARLLGYKVVPIDETTTDTATE